MGDTKDVMDRVRKIIKETDREGGGKQARFGIGTANRTDPDQ